MNYYLDTEFHEYKKKPFIGKAIDTIELISIGIVAEDDREYYAVSNEFDLKATWSNEWLRDNVLLNIVHDLARKDYKEKDAYMHDFGSYTNWLKYIKKGNNWEKTWYKRSKELINKYGKSREQIATEIKEFVTMSNVLTFELSPNSISPVNMTPINFYAYYADYDWVVFCWLFGRMIDLPKGFPMYCIDLKQELDNKAIDFEKESWIGKGNGVEYLKDRIEYPKQDNEHNALDDAKWNLKLHKFIQSL